MCFVAECARDQVGWSAALHEVLCHRGTEVLHPTKERDWSVYIHSLCVFREEYVMSISAT